MPPSLEDYLSQAQNLKRNNLVMKLNSVMHGVTQ